MQGIHACRRSQRQRRPFQWPQPHPCVPPCGFRMLPLRENTTPSPFSLVRSVKNSIDKTVLITQFWIFIKSIMQGFALGELNIWGLETKRHPMSLPWFPMRCTPAECSGWRESAPLESSKNCKFYTIFQRKIENSAKNL